MNSHRKKNELKLWPLPKELKFFDGHFNLPSHSYRLNGVPEKLAKVEGCSEGFIIGDAKKSDLPEQSYCIVIRFEKVTLEYGDEAGLQYGLRTLSQIFSQECIPELEIYDEPTIKIRAIMLDVSRDRIPTMETLYGIIDQAAALKANHIQLYLEHSFAYKDHEIVWREASPMTSEELKKLDKYTHERGIDLSVCQNMFGHTERWLIHEPYDQMGNFDNIKERVSEGGGPFSFNPTHPDSLSLPLEWGKELKPLLESGIINFGGDETVDLGQGASEALVKKNGLANVYANHLKALAEGLQKQNWKCQFWADIALEHPKLLESLPNNLTALAWGYESDSDFERWGQRLKASGMSWWACPGTSAWRSLVGRRDARSGSIISAFSASLKYGAEGMMITDWGDVGHRQTLPWTWLGWSEGLGVAWSGEMEFDWESLSRCTFPSWPIETASWMDEISAVEQDIRQDCTHPIRGGKLINASLPFVDSLLDWDDDKFLPDLKTWHKFMVKYDQMLKNCPVGDEQLLHGLNQVRWLCERACLRRSKGSTEGWKQRGYDLIESHQRLWLQTDRVGGLKDSLSHFEKLIEHAQ
jgi:hypothetical protein